jgi:hypothetical protein
MHRDVDGARLQVDADGRAASRRRLVRRPQVRSGGRIPRRDLVRDGATTTPSATTGVVRYWGLPLTLAFHRMIPVPASTAYTVGPALTYTLPPATVTPPLMSPLSISCQPRQPAAAPLRAPRPRRPLPATAHVMSCCHQPSWPYTVHCTPTWAMVKDRERKRGCTTAAHRHGGDTVKLQMSQC